MDNARPQLTAAVCAHVGIGADDSVARAARDRLGNALANYRRRASNGQQVSSGQHATKGQPIEDRLLPGDGDFKLG